MKKISVFVLMLMCLVMVSNAREILIACIDFQTIIQNFEKAQNVQDLLRIELEKRQTELDSLKKELTEKKEALEAKQKTMDKEQFKKEASDFQVEVIGFQKKTRQYEQEIKQLEADHFKSLREDINKVVEQLAGKMKIKYVVEKEAVHFGGVDITQDVIKELNK